MNSALVRFLISLTAIFLMSSANCFACAACTGTTDSPTASAMNDAIFFMLGIVGCVLLALLGFALHLVRRQREIARQIARQKSSSLAEGEFRSV